MEAGQSIQDNYEDPQRLFELEQRIRKLEHQIANQKSRHDDLMSSFIRHLPAAVAMFDEDMKYLKVSERWVEDYHVSESKILGRTMYEVYPNIPQRWKDVHKRCMKGVTESCIEDEFVQGDGFVDYINWVATPWYKENGEQGGIILLTEKITEQVEAKRKILELNKTLKMAKERLESFLTIVSQHLEDPLKAIEHHSSQILIKAEEKGREEVSEIFKHIEEIQKSIKSMTEEVRKNQS